MKLSGMFRIGFVAAIVTALILLPSCIAPGNGGVASGKSAAIQLFKLDPDLHRLPGLVKASEIPPPRAEDIENLPHVDGKPILTKGSKNFDFMLRVASTYPHKFYYLQEPMEPILVEPTETKQFSNLNPDVKQKIQHAVNGYSAAKQKYGERVASMIWGKPYVLTDDPDGRLKPSIPIKLYPRFRYDAPKKDMVRALQHHGRFRVYKNSGGDKVGYKVFLKNPGSTGELMDVSVEPLTWLERSQERTMALARQSSVRASRKTCDEHATQAVIKILDIVTPSAQILVTFLCLAEKICLTAAIEDRRTERDLQDNFVKLIDSCILISGRLFDQSTWNRRSGRDNGEELDREAAEFVAELLSLEDEKLSVNADGNSANGVIDAINHFLATRGLPALRKIQMDTDSVQAIVANAAYYLVRMPGSVKAWRSTVADLFNDARFFSIRLHQAERFKPIMLALMSQDKERLMDLLARVSASAAAANFFTNRELEMLSRALNLRRLSFTLVSSEQDGFLTQLPLIQEKLVDLLRSQNAFESNYGDQEVDLHDVDACLLADMFDSGDTSVAVVEELASGGMNA
ncbi:uncharacterized protein UBRO2_05808 [Ustilago bromivora]|uniref:DOP1-like C-terminal domain-containing protein n=1 Tax=Ustilago bromivora TaxID=307758 RepID=A0A8H8QSC0_9BASI|nr:uncharacterized protein UBRO2_05808 [Ustilago bromivora]